MPDTERAEQEFRLGCGGAEWETPIGRLPEGRAAARAYKPRASARFPVSRRRGFVTARSARNASSAAIVKHDNCAELSSGASPKCWHRSRKIVCIRRGPRESAMQSFLSI